MRYVIFVEVFAIVNGFEPELTKSFPLSIRSDDTIKPDETCQAYAVQSFGVEDGSCVANSLCHVYVLVSSIFKRIP